MSIEKLTRKAYTKDHICKLQSFFLCYINNFYQRFLVDFTKLQIKYHYT